MQGGQELRLIAHEVQEEQTAEKDAEGVAEMSGADSVAPDDGWGLNFG
ncbi:MAG: hypothetical protein NZM04_04970 [Methylacidiphilales bacterium]|nr:hypothetical protein [Candidatus Methylacidiphilales bacterium]MDW8349454.1 hypothetical protein [Verrucomicrobiae bacterium]